MVTQNATDPYDAPKDATFIHEMQQTDQKYFEGTKSLWLHSRVVDEGLAIGRGSYTNAETEDWINAPLATHVRIYMRDIKSTHSLGWGWANSIFLYINNVSVAKTYALNQYWPMIFTHGETLNWNQYNYTAVGADGQNWYVYEYGIPDSVDKTHMKIQIKCLAWDWTFYSTSYFSDLEFVVDKVELFTPEPPEQYELTVTSSPLTGIPFKINGEWKATPYTDSLVEGSYTLEMSETYSSYVWSHWLEDGDTNRTKTITLPGTTWTAVYKEKPPPPVGGATVSIDSSGFSTWIASTLLLVSAVAISSVYIKRKISQN